MKTAGAFMMLCSIIFADLISKGAGMSLKKKNISKINMILFAAASLCICGFIALSVIRHNYRSYEGTYVRRYLSEDKSGYGEPEGTSRFERKQIVNVSGRDGGYDIEYIISADMDIIREKNDESFLFEEEDTYKEYHGFISERMAKEGCIFECSEAVSGNTEYIGLYFTQNGVCVLDNITLTVGENKDKYSLVNAPEYDEEYTLKDMLTAPQNERKYGLTDGMAHVCEKTGYNVCAILDLAANITGAAASVLLAAAVITAAAQGRRKTAVIGAAVFAAAAVSSFVLIPGQTVAGDYVMLNFRGEMNGNIINSILSGNLEESDLTNNYDNFNIAPLGNGKYIVLFYYGSGSFRNIASIRIGETGLCGRLVIDADMASGNKVTIIPKGDKISVRGNLRPIDTVYEYEKTGPYAYDMQLRYIILLSFAASSVVLLIMTIRRRRRLSLNPVIPEGSYVVTDIIYINGEMEYMRDYAYRSLKGTSVVIGSGSLEIDGRNMGGCECEREYMGKNAEFLRKLGIRRGLCVKPVGNTQDSGESADAEYRMIFDRKRRAFVYAAEGCPIAVFGLKCVNTQV